MSSAHKPDSNQNNPTIDQNKTNRDGSSLRKSFDYDKNRVPEEILKKGVLQKPNLFKNLSKNMNLKLIGKNLNKEPAAVKVKKSDSMISGSMSIKTNENV